MYPGLLDLKGGLEEIRDLMNLLKRISNNEEKEDLKVSPKELDEDLNKMSEEFDKDVDKLGAETEASGYWRRNRILTTTGN